MDDKLKCRGLSLKIFKKNVEKGKVMITSIFCSYHVFSETVFLRVINIWGCLVTSNVSCRFHMQSVATFTDIRLILKL